MKRQGSLRHLRRYGCVLPREGKEHHSEITSIPARKICRKLSIPQPPGQVPAANSMAMFEHPASAVVALRGPMLT